MRAKQKHTAGSRTPFIKLSGNPVFWEISVALSTTLSYLRCSMLQLNPGQRLSRPSCQQWTNVTTLGLPRKMRVISDQRYWGRAAQQSSLGRFLICSKAVNNMERSGTTLCWCVTSWRLMILTAQSAKSCQNQENGCRHVQPGHPPRGSDLRRQLITMSLVSTTAFKTNGPSLKTCTLALHAATYVCLFWHAHARNQLQHCQQQEG